MSFASIASKKVFSLLKVSYTNPGGTTARKWRGKGEIAKDGFCSEISNVHSSRSWFKNTKLDGARCCSVASGSPQGTAKECHMLRKQRPTLRGYIGLRLPSGVHPNQPDGLSRFVSLLCSQERSVLLQN